jgi:hypothetical protein
MQSSAGQGSRGRGVVQTLARLGFGGLPAGGLPVAEPVAEDMAVAGWTGQLRLDPFDTQALDEQVDIELLVGLLERAPVKLAADGPHPLALKLGLDERSANQLPAGIVLGCQRPCLEARLAALLVLATAPTRAGVVAPNLHRPRVRPRRDWSVALPDAQAAPRRCGEVGSSGIRVTTGIPARRRIINHY